MPIAGTNTMSRVLRILLDLILLLNILALMLLPILLTALYNDPDLLLQLDKQSADFLPDSTSRLEYPSDLPPSSYFFYLGFLYAAGLGTAWILLEGHLILRRLEKNQPFAARQAASFRRVGVAFAWLAAAFAVKVIFYNTLMTLFCFGLFLLLVLVALILADIFCQAYLVKSENELTI
jgi:hypothetical protein